MPAGISSSLARLRVLRGTDPAANTEISEVVPDGVQWVLRSLAVDLVQGLTQTPLPVLRILTPADAADEVQSITLGATPSGGSLKLTAVSPGWPYTGDQETAAISGVGNLSAAEIQSALRALDGLDAVTVTGSDGGPFEVTFVGAKASGRAWPLLTVTANTLTPATTVTVAETTPGKTGGALYESPGSSAAQAVSTTCRYTWGEDLSLSGQIGSGSGVRSFAPLPEIVLNPGDRIQTTTVGKGANTDYGAPLLTVVEYG